MATLKIKKKICVRCHNKINVSKFAVRYKNGKKRGIRGHYVKCQNAATCKSVRENRGRVNASRSNRWDYKRIIVKNYLSRHPCVDCGEGNIKLLQFDHIRGKKSFMISLSLRNVSLIRLFNEIKKCEIRCVNCHLKRTSIHQKWGQSIRSDRKKTHDIINKIKSDSGCIDCGITDHIVLQFDHIGNKIANVCGLICRSRKLVMDEIKKCAVRCGNCHTIKTLGEL